MAPHRPVLPSGEQVELRHGDRRATVVELGGALRAYAVGAWEVLDGYAADEMCTGARGQSLIPWPNRLRDGRYAFAGQAHQVPLSEPERGNAIHGLVRWMRWAVGERTEDAVTMELEALPQAGYPFALRLALAYRLDATGLTVTLHAENVGSGPCPFGAGAHPYLAVGTPTIDGATVRAPGRRRMLADDRGIPVGREPVDGTIYDLRAPRAIDGLELDTATATSSATRTAAPAWSCGARAASRTRPSGSKRAIPTSCSSRATPSRSPGVAAAAWESSR